MRYSQPVAVLMADVDGLKQINDRPGHRVGSMALIKTARAIASEMRSSDIAARWGGDELGVLAPNTNAAAARVLAERILESQALEGEAECPAVGLSIGVAAFEPDLAAPPTAQGLLQTADNALYDAKRAGRRRVSASIDLAARAGTPERASSHATSRDRCRAGGTVRTGQLAARTTLSHVDPSTARPNVRVRAVP